MRMRLASSVSLVAPCRGNTVVVVVSTKNPEPRNPASSIQKAGCLDRDEDGEGDELLITIMLVSMMIMMLMLLLVHAQDNDGDDDRYGDNNDNDSVAPCCC